MGHPVYCISVLTISQILSLLFQSLDADSVPDALRLDLQCSLASLRCRMYGIAPAAVDRRDVRLFDHRQQQGQHGAAALAGCPCPAPLADVLAGLVCMLGNVFFFVQLILVLVRLYRRPRLL